MGGTNNERCGTGKIIANYEVMKAAVVVPLPR